MLKKILGWTVKTLVGLFIFYVFLGFVIIPFALTWAIKAKGTEILQHPVAVRAVYFNPFLLKLTIHGLQILNTRKEVMAGFERFDADVSFISLFKKEYRVELIGLDGLQVNPVLMPDGKINLMDLVPAPSAAPDPAAVKESATAPAAPLPLVVVDKIDIRRGNVRFIDTMVQPNFVCDLGAINVEVTGISTAPESKTRVVFNATLGESGAISSEVLVKPMAQPIELETTFTLDSFALDILSPYVGKYTGRSLRDGVLEFKMDYRIGDNQLTAGHKVLIQRFEFGQKVDSKDALPLPFGLAVGLLEDPQGRIKIALPVTGDLSKPDFEYWPLVGQVVRNFFMGLVTKPFAFLASSLGYESGTDELGHVKFLPGQSELSDVEKEKITLLLNGLKDRPKLRLEVNGGYDPKADWTAIKTDALQKAYAELRAQSTRSDSWIYQMIYQRAFGIRALWDLTAKYKIKQGNYDDAKLIAEIRRQMIENAPPDLQALGELANTRARAVNDFILSTGFDAQRLSVGLNHEVQASMGFVPLEFTLTVFGEEPPPSS